MAHIVNLAQQAFIRALTGNTDGFVETLSGNTGDDDEIELATSGLEIPMDGGTLIRPLLSRIRALIVRVSYDSTVAISQSDIQLQQIRKSPGAKLYLRECCAKVSIKPLELVMYGNTRWGSWLILLNRFIELQPVRHYLKLSSYSLITLLFYW
jgi:hypothetical protein